MLDRGQPRDKKPSALDASLHGNHDACPACAMRREVQDTAPIEREPVPCNVCDGRGFIPLAAIEIVKRTCEEARRVYWPAFEARMLAHLLSEEH